MCNLYHMAPRDHVEVFFRTQVPSSYVAAAVGPFGTGAFLRATPGGLDSGWKRVLLRPADRVG